MANLMLGVLIRQCLNRRIANKATLDHELKDRQEDLITKVVRADWQFTTATACRRWAAS